MIKRRFYRVDRADKEKDGSSGSDSSDSEVEVRSSDDSDNEQPNPEPKPKSEPASNVEADNNNNDEDEDEDEEDDDDDDRLSLRVHRPSSSSSGYESEDSSANEIDADSGGFLANDDDSGSGKDGDQHKEPLFPRKENGEMIETLANEHPVVNDLPKCVLQSKSAFKCRLCPKIVCLNEESLKSHLKSKRHSRSEKLLKEGRLKRVLNSDGEEEVMSDDDGETHAERHARIIAMAKPSQPSQDTSTKKSRGRQRQRQRLKRKKQSKSSNVPKSGEQRENRAKRRRKNVD